MEMYITAQQIKLFAQFGWIEFEEFFTKERCEALLGSLEKVIKKRLRRGLHEDSQAIYLAGRDLWRKNEELKRLACSKLLSAPAASLSNKQILQLACDQLIPSGYALSPLNMEAHLSFQSLICGCLLALDGEKAGCVRYCHSNRLPLFEGTQLLIAYGSLETVYIHNPQDPSNGALKELGYNFGDRLNAKHHPLCS